MAEDGPDAEDRTEAATPQRIERARRDGDVALSREAVHVASLAGGALGVAMVGEAGARGLAEAGAALLSGASFLDPAAALAALLPPAALLAFAGLGLASAGALVATLLQTGFLVRAAVLAPELSRISPMAGAKRLFGREALAELLRTVIKLGVVGAALWSAGRDLEGLAAALATDAGHLAGEAASRVAGLVVATLAAMAALALLDLVWVRFGQARRLRMSRQELREEMRDSEGDPYLKARRNQIMRSRGRRRMLAAVPEATVVVTNPTHYAVALAYERGRDAAPRIVAKGVDALAARIRQVAEDHGVPVVPNPPLARALWRLEEDAEIPEAHFKAVAEVIAFVMRLRAGAGAR